jgi:hypothetical protein
MMAQMDLLVMVNPAARQDLDRVAKTLEAQGFHVQQKLPRFRTILGTGESSLIERLRSVEGVESVRPQEKFQLPPLDESVPQ